jgi:hypothetical protein
MRQITLSNDFHNTEVRIRVASLPATLSPSQGARVRRQLCGQRDCTCGDVRGRQIQPDGARVRVVQGYDGNGRDVLVVYAPTCFWCGRDLETLAERRRESCEQCRAAMEVPNEHR